MATFWINTHFAPPASPWKVISIGKWCFRIQPRLFLIDRSHYSHICSCSVGVKVDLALKMQFLAILRPFLAHFLRFFLPWGTLVGLQSNWWVTLVTLLDFQASGATTATKLINSYPQKWPIFLYGPFETLPHLQNCSKRLHMNSYGLLRISG